MSSDENQRKPPRPQSIIAQKFSQDLDSLFGLNSPSELAQSVETKKKTVTTQNAELEALETRLKETEARLKAQQQGKHAVRVTAHNANKAPSQRTGTHGPAYTSQGLRGLPNGAQPRKPPPAGLHQAKPLETNDDDDDDDDDEDNDEEDDDDEEEEEEAEESEDDSDDSDGKSTGESSSEDSRAPRR